MLSSAFLKCFFLIKAEEIICGRSVDSFASLALASGILHAGPVTVLSSGFLLPETISTAPSGFGLSSGSVVGLDVGPGGMGPFAIYSVPSGGGAPTAIGGTISGSFTQGGVFAPVAFGSLSGDYVAFGQGAATDAAAIYSLNSAAGTASIFYSDTSGNNTIFAGSPVVAPSGFGSVGGDILSTEFNNSAGTEFIAALSPAGTLSDFANLDVTLDGFGTAFAPAGFIPGTSTPTLLVSDGLSGNIEWIDSLGNSHLFTTIPLAPGQTGLRQLAFAPAGFGTYGGDLFVSVSGSDNGGGTFGSVDVINSAGQMVGIISQGTVGAPFDPRGLDFASSSELLIPDADPSIYAASAAAVTAVSATPEPNTAWFAATAFFAYLGLRKMRSTKRS